MRHLTKQELIEKHKNLAAMRNRQYSAPFSAMSITWNYILWTEYGFRAERLQQFNQGVYDYLEQNNLDDMSNLQERLFQKAEFKVEYEPYKIPIGKNYKTKAYAEEMEIQNGINQYSTYYNLCAFNYMMDKGYGKKRLEELKDKLVEFLNKIDTDKFDTMTIHRELANNGIVIELPKQEER